MLVDYSSLTPRSTGLMPVFPVKYYIVATLQDLANAYCTLARAPRTWKEVQRSKQTAYSKIYGQNRK